MNFFRDRQAAKFESEIKKASILKFLEGLFIGLSVGSFIGVLLAPKSGKDTLEDIKYGSVKLKDGLVEKGKSIMPDRKKDVEESIEE